MSGYIVISYAREDKPFVDRLFNLLQMTTLYTVWYDRELRGGQSYPTVIAKEIERCDCFIFVASRHSAQSKPCGKELDQANAHEKPIVPINLSMSDDEYRSAFASLVSIQRVDMPGADLTAEKFSEVIKALAENLGTSYLDQSKTLDRTGVVEAQPKGIVAFSNRQEALQEFAQALENERREIMVIGSSLKGLFRADDYKDTFDILRKKMDANVPVYFLLTHPGYADIRAEQEGRPLGAIGREIIDSLRLLVENGVPPASIGLYRGSPTTFAIKTTTKMLLNPYPYRVEAFRSPCLIVDRREAFYSRFGANHFSVWDTMNIEFVGDTPEEFDVIMQRLENSLSRFTEAFRALRLEIDRASQR